MNETTPGPGQAQSIWPGRPKIRRSAGIKLILICFLVLLMAIPAMFIGAISYERSSTARDVIRDVSERYGGQQTLVGPILAVPYRVMDEDSRQVETGHYILYADDGEARLSDITVETKTQSLYKIPIYTAKGRLSARFSNPRERLAAQDLTFDLDAAQLFVSVSDVRGLKQDMRLRGPDGQMRSFEPAILGEGSRYLPGVKNADGTVLRPMSQKEVFQAPSFGTWLAVDAGDWLQSDGGFEVALDVLLSGAESLSVTPFAKSTRVRMASNWADPGFQGEFTPLSREITDSGFTADWNMPYISRGIAAEGKAQNVISRLTQNQVRVKFVSTDNPYQTVNRALKYSVLFIGMVFLAYFLFEVIVGVPVHPAQYILIGLAQAIFYLLLLAFAERIGFSAAFGVAATLTILATAGYAGAVFGGRSYIWKAGSVFAIVYGLLFVLMKMEDFALMIGSLASFIAIAATMYLTRNIDWYGGKTSS